MVCRWEGGGMSVQSKGGGWGKTSVKTFSIRFLKKLTEGAVKMEAGSFFNIPRTDGLYISKWKFSIHPSKHTVYDLNDI